MASEIRKNDQSSPEPAAGVKRRGLLRFGTLITAFTGASAISALGAGSAHAATADKNPPTDYVPIAQKGAASGVATLDVGSKIPQVQLPDLSATYVPVVASGTGLYKVPDASGTHEPTPIFGDAGSMGFAGSGSPAGIAGGMGWYKRFGDGSPGSPVLKTTQGIYGNTLYYGPTTDDSAEGGSSTIYLKDDGNLGWSQTKPVTGWEANVRVEGDVQAGTDDSAPVGGMGARLNVLGTAHVGSAYGFKTSTQNDAGATGTVEKYVAFWQQAASRAAKPFGMYVIDPANSESQLSVARSTGTAFIVRYGGGEDGSSSLVRLGQPTISYGTLSGTYTLTPAAQTLTVNAGAALPASGGSFMLDSSGRTIVTYSAFSGTTITGAAIASGSVTTSNGQALLDPATPNTTALRINAQKAQGKNLTEWFDSGANLRVRVNAQGNLITQGTSIYAANGSAFSLAEMSGSAGYVRPGTTAGPGSRIFSGSGAPNVSSAAAGDTYIRTDTPTTINQRIYIATASNTWIGII